MRKLMNFSYLLAVLLGIAILIVSAVNDNFIIKNTNNPTSIKTITEFNKDFTDDTAQYTFSAPSEIANGLNLCIYTVHNEVEITIDGELRYEDKVSSEMFGQSTGYNWAFVPLYKSDEGSSITINTSNCYNSNVNHSVQMYFGSVPSVYQRVFSIYIYAYTVGFILIVIGIGLIVFFFATRKYNKNEVYQNVNISIIALGVFSILLGSWSCNQAPLSSLFIQHEILNLNLTMVPFVLMIPAFIFFAKALFGKYETITYNLISISTIGAALVMFSLQLMEIVDLRESIIFYHALIGISAAAIITMAVREYIQHKISPALKSLIIPVALCALGSCADVVNYYLGGFDSNIFGRFGFLIFIIFASKFAISLSIDLRVSVKQTDLYKRLAESDSMTNFHNRAALSFTLHNANYSNSMDYGFVMLDLNNLKYCNDNLGHKIGDEYIIEASKLINEAFNDYGTCYRYGGDEFVVMIESPSWKITSEKLNQLDEMQKKFNEESRPYTMGIAWGYSEFSKGQDITLDDTLIRADKNMYERKLKMKSSSQN